MVLHLDEEEEVDEDAEETWEEEGYGDDEKQQFAAAAADDDRGEARNRESVAIDVEGRVGGVSDCGLDFSFRSYPESFDRYAGLSSPEARDVITEDCRKCFVGESFWLAAGSEPRCALEELARKVFELHVAGIDGTWDAAKSGAE